MDRNAEYMDGAKGVAINRGDGAIYYHSGQIALQITCTEGIYYQYFIFDDDSKHSVLGSIDDKGCGHVHKKSNTSECLGLNCQVIDTTNKETTRCTKFELSSGTNSKCKNCPHYKSEHTQGATLTFTLDRVTLSDESGGLTKTIKYDENSIYNPPDNEIIKIDINKCFSLEYVNIRNITLIFKSDNIFEQFNCGYQERNPVTANTRKGRSLPNINIRRKFVPSSNSRSNKSSMSNTRNNISPETNIGKLITELDNTKTLYLQRMKESSTSDVYFKETNRHQSMLKTFLELPRYPETGNEVGHLPKGLGDGKVSIPIYSSKDNNTDRVNNNDSLKGVDKELLDTLNSTVNKSSIPRYRRTTREIKEEIKRDNPHLERPSMLKYFRGNYNMNFHKPPSIQVKTLQPVDFNGLENFISENSNDQLLFVYFYKSDDIPSRGPERLLEYVNGEVSSQDDNQYLMVKVNTGESISLTSKYQIATLPLFCIYSHTKLIYRGDLGGKSTTVRETSFPPRALLVENNPSDQIEGEKLFKCEKIDYDLSLNINQSIEYLQKVFRLKSPTIVECFRTGLYYGLIFISSYHPINEYKSFLNQLAQITKRVDLPPPIYILTVPPGTIPYRNKACYRCNNKIPKCNTFYSCPRCHLVYNPDNELSNKYGADIYVIKPLNRLTIINLHSIWREQSYTNTPSQYNIQTLIDSQSKSGITKESVKALLSSCLNQSQKGNAYQIEKSKYVFPLDNITFRGGTLRPSNLEE